MQAIIIGIKQLHKELRAVTESAQSGQSFIVVKHAKPAFRIEPIRSPKNKQYTLDDLRTIRFSTKEKKLSQNIDRMVYGV